MAEAASSSENMLVKIANLDKLLNLAGDVIISSSNLGLAQKNLQALFDSSQQVNQDMVDSVSDLATTSADISSELHHLVQDIRTVDLKDLSFRTRRVVRDISRKTGKQVMLTFEGEDTSIDKTIVEKIYDPISHQLRNAIDHGIEDAITRERQGKPVEGHIVLRVYNTESETFVEIEDDGAGVDMVAVKGKAIDLGKLAEGDELTEDIALDVICSAGVSTAKVVSEVSGRGVGMDVVRSHITELGGTISFRTEEGKGSTFTFRVPLVSAVNIVDALVVRSGRFLFGFPISSVISSMSIPKEEITSTLGKGKMVKHLNSLLPLHCLNELLDRERINEGVCSETEEEGDGTIPILVIGHKGTQIALKITEFLSPQKLVIIPFNGALNVDGLAGTTVLGGRKLGFIIDITSLVARASGKGYLSATQLKAGKNGTKGGRTDTAAVESKTDNDTVKTPKAGPVVEDDTDGAFADVMQEFIVEIEKMMPQLNEALFSLENDPADSEQINLAFRIFHTIKGNLIMTGYAKGGETVHSVESVLDFARSGKVDISPEVMDVLMDGVSYVEDLVRHSKSGTWVDKVSDEILLAGARILPKKEDLGATVVDVSLGDIRFSHEASYRAVDYRKQRIPLYQFYVEFDHGKQPSFLVACLIYKVVCELGDVLGTLPPLVDIENGLVDGKMKLQFVSSIAPEKLEKTLVSHLTKHYGVNVADLTQFS